MWHGWDKTAERLTAHHCQTMVGRRSPKARVCPPSPPQGGNLNMPLRRSAFLACTTDLPRNLSGEVANCSPVAENRAATVPVAGAWRVESNFWRW